MVSALGFDLWKIKGGKSLRNPGHHSKFCELFFQLSEDFRKICSFLFQLFCLKSDKWTQKHITFSEEVTPHTNNRNKQRVQTTHVQNSCIDTQCSITVNALFTETNSTYYNSNFCVDKPTLNLPLKDSS